MSLLKLEDCPDPELPYASPLPYSLELEVFNSSKGYSLIRGNLTVPRDIPGRDKRGTFSYGKRTPTGIKWRYTMRDLKCNNFVAKAIIGGFGVPLKGCVVRRGEYTFKDIDVDAIDSAFVATPATVYGLHVSRTTVASKTETLGCWLCHLKVEPLTKNNG